MYPTAGQAAGAPLAYIHYQYIICSEAKVQYMYHRVPEGIIKMVLYNRGVCRSWSLCHCCRRHFSCAQFISVVSID